MNRTDSSARKSISRRLWGSLNATISAMLPDSVEISRRSIYYCDEMGEEGRFNISFGWVRGICSDANLSHLASALYGGSPAWARGSYGRTGS